VLVPNARDIDGTPVWLHHGEPGPLHVAIREPLVPARGSDPQETRLMAVRGFREWEQAIRRQLPAFRLEVASEDPAAEIQVVWSRRPAHLLTGAGEIHYERIGDAAGVRGSITLSTQPAAAPRYTATLADVRAFATHAFGRALGLTDCTGCASVMSSDWRAERPARVRPLDVQSYARLIRQPSGMRVDGRALRPLDPNAAATGWSSADAGTADLELINTGHASEFRVDLAAPGDPPMPLAVMTGSRSSLMSADYARALGVSVHVVQTERYRRSTVTGADLEFDVWDPPAVDTQEWQGFGVVGGAFLARYVLEFDLPARRLRLRDPGIAAQDAPGEVVVPLEIREGRPFVPLRLGRRDGEPAWALLDSGTGAQVVLSSRQADASGLAAATGVARVEHHGPRGLEVFKPTVPVPVFVGDMDLGELRVAIIDVVASKPLLGRPAPPAPRIGLSAFRGLRITIDYEGSRLRLARR